MTGLLPLFNADYVECDALISHDGRYRYRLRRTWDADKPSVLFVMLNPSTADAAQDDQTIRRCMGFARGWGYGTLLVGNLYALRATNPRALADDPDPVGRADEHLRAMVDQTTETVVAWGAHPMVTRREPEVVRLLREQQPGLICLGRTHASYPRHPSRLPKSVQREWYQ